MVGSPPLPAHHFTVKATQTSCVRLPPSVASSEFLEEYVVGLVVDAKSRRLAKMPHKVPGNFKSFGVLHFYLKDIGEKGNMYIHIYIYM